MNICSLSFCLSVSLSLCLSVSLSLYLSVSLSFCLFTILRIEHSFFVCLSFCIFVFLSFVFCLLSFCFLFFCLSAFFYLSSCFSVFLFRCFSVFLSFLSFYIMDQTFVFCLSTLRKRNIPLNLQHIVLFFSLFLYCPFSLSLSLSLSLSPPSCHSLGISPCFYISVSNCLSTIAYCKIIQLQWKPLNVITESVIIRLMLSVCLGPKVITLSSFPCFIFI